jgi:hypothetical protein
LDGGDMTLKVNTITNVAGTGAPNIPDGVTIAGTALASVNQLEYTSSASEPASPSDGALWWDTSDDKFYMYVNDTWVEVSYSNLPPPPFVGSRGLFGGGYTTTDINTIDYVTIATPSNAVDFGDLTASMRFLSCCSNGTRGIFGGGTASSNTNVIDYVTIATTGNATDFGDLTVARFGLAACSDGTYGVFGGGAGPSNVIDYVTIATAGNATDFGDLTEYRSYRGACSDGIYGLWGGGLSLTNTIGYVTIATPSNATDFGNLTVARYGLAACSGD